MSEFDKLKDDAEQYAQKHPEQVEKGEEAVEKKLGLPGQDQQGQDQQGQDQQGQDQQGQNQQGQGGQAPTRPAIRAGPRTPPVRVGKGQPGNLTDRRRGHWPGGGPLLARGEPRTYSRYPATVSLAS